MNDDILRLKAKLLVQAADTSALLTTIQLIENAVRPAHPDLPDLSQVFLTRRKAVLHLILEQLETRNPAFAAQMQALIDRDAQNQPFDY